MPLQLRTRMRAVITVRRAVLPQATSLAARWMADSITPQGDNTTLSAWTDAINGYTATQAVGGNQPLYRAARMGGRASVQFTGSKWLAGSFPALKAVFDAREHTVLLAVSHTVSAPNGCVFGNSAGANSILYMNSGTALGRFANNAGLQVPYLPTAFTTFGGTSRPTKQYTLQSGTGVERAYVNGCCVASRDSAAPVTSSASGAFAFGAMADTGLLSSKCDVYEVIVWNKVLTPLEMLQAEAYLRTKYSQALPWAGLTSLDLYMGDSLQVGVGSTGAHQSPAYLSATARGRSLGQWVMWAVGGMDWVSINQALPEVANLAAYMGVPVNIGAFEWYNEKNAGRNAATILANAQTFCTAARAISGAKLCLLSSTGYSGDATDPYPSVRGSYNSLLDTNFASMCDQYGAIHNDATAGPAIGNATAYATNSAANWSDTVHLKPAGYAFLGNYQASQMTAMRA